MKTARKVSLFIAIILLVCALLLGCKSIPEEYTKGVKLSRDFPDDDMPIMDDEVIFYSDDEDEFVTIEYGVEEDLDDVVDFYKDHFEDNEIVLDDETDKSSRYSAEGYYKDFFFEIKISLPSGEYEEDLFETVVKIEIEFVDTNTQMPTADRLVGFWRQETYEGDVDAVSTLEGGIATEFFTDGSSIRYAYFEFFGSSNWTVIDENTVRMYGSDFEDDVTVTFEIRDGIDYMIWDDFTGTLVFFRDTSEDFLVYTPSIEDADNKLAAELTADTWNYAYYSDPDGKKFSSISATIIYSSNGRFEDTFEGEKDTGSWYVNYGVLHYDYDDDTSIVWDMEIKTVDGIKELFFYSSTNAEFWVYSNEPVDLAVTTYDTDADMTRLVANIDWRMLYYLNADGSTETMDPNSLFFREDGSFDHTSNGETQSGTWYFDNEYLNLIYSDDSNYHYPAYIEYHEDTDTWLFYNGDPAEGFEGCQWVFTSKP